MSTFCNELPEKYSSHENLGLTATVVADGENVFNFDLTSEYVLSLLGSNTSE